MSYNQIFRCALFAPKSVPLEKSKQPVSSAPKSKRTFVTYGYGSHVDCESTGQQPAAVNEEESEQLRARFLDQLHEVMHQHTLSTENIVLGVNQDFMVCFVNDSWQRRAEAVQQPAVQAERLYGRSMLGMMRGPVRPYYERALRRALYNLEPWHHRYLCRSPHALEEWSLAAYPLQDRSGLLLIHTLVVQRPPASSYAAVDERYLQENGKILVCCHCGHTRRNGDVDTWDYVPAYVGPEEPLPVESALCPPCYEYYPALPSNPERPAPP